MMDVARRAGVSHQTVSRVLNKPELVRPDTREKVLAAIAELGYRPNSAARALVTRRTRLIGVINAGMSYFGPSHTAMAIESAARTAGYATVASRADDAAAGPRETLDFFLDLAVEGLIVVAPTDEVADAARRLAGTLPIVIVATGLTAPEPMHVVAVDHEQGARDAVAHLISLGHRSIAHVAGPPNWFDARARVTGWRRELARADLPVPEPLAGGWDAADGYRAADTLLALPERPTAVFAANDLTALGLMRRLHEAGVRVPEDIAVVGYDDTAGSAYFSPPLTTVRQPFEAVGAHAIDTLLRSIAGAQPSNVLIVPTVVLRDSSGSR